MKTGIQKLIEALEIFSKYTNDDFPIYCEHDSFHVNVDFDVVSEEDKKRLDNLSFFEDNYGKFKSFHFGSC